MLIEFSHVTRFLFLDSDFKVIETQGEIEINLFLIRFSKTLTLNGGGGGAGGTYFIN